MPLDVLEASRFQEVGRFEGWGGGWGGGGGGRGKAGCRVVWDVPNALSLGYLIAIWNNRD